MVPHFSSYCWVYCCTSVYASLPPFGAGDTFSSEIALPSIGAGGTCASRGGLSSCLKGWSPCLWGIFFMWLVRVMSLFWSLTSYNLFRWCQCQKPLTVQSVQAVSAFLGAAYAREGGWGWHEELAMWLQGPTGISWWSDLSTGALPAGRIVGL